MDDTISRRAVLRLIRNAVPEEEAVTAWALQQGVKQLPSVQPEPSTERQEILEYLDTVLHPIISPEHWDVYSELHDMISSLPTEQPEPLTEDWMERNKERILQAGMEGREIEFRIGGRLFAIREKAQ